VTTIVKSFQQQPCRMPQPFNGITAEVIRNGMPLYHLSADLLNATLATLPPPPQHASTPTRQV